MAFIKPAILSLLVNADLNENVVINKLFFCLVILKEHVKSLKNNFQDICVHTYFIFLIAATVWE